MRSKFLATAAVAAVAVLPLAACGDDSSSTGTTAGGGDAALTVKASDSLKFDKNSYDVAAGGETSVEYVNNGSAMHTLVIEGVSGFRLQVSGKGDTDSGSVELESGQTYTIFCDIPGHRQGGMEATVTVG